MYPRVSPLRREDTGPVDGIFLISLESCAEASDEVQRNNL